MCGCLESLALPRGSLQCVRAFDVIELLERPRPLLQEIRRVLQPDGLLIATAPAMPFLWGDEHEVASHFRRHNVNGL